jgi:para-nitrobenzyl esterase
MATFMFKTAPPAILVLLAAANTSHAQVVETPVPGGPVKIDSGLVSGKVLANGVKAYLGIPFVAPPVRELRWREPQPVKPWKGVYHAGRTMPECTQVLRAHNINHYFGEEATSETACISMFGRLRGRARVQGSP